IGDDEEPKRGRRGHRRCPWTIRHERDLAEEVAGAHRVDLASLPPHVGGAFDQDEELAARRPLRREHLALGHVDLVGEERDAPELALRAVGEERCPLEKLDLRVAPQHAASLNRTPRPAKPAASGARVATLARWGLPSCAARVTPGRSTRGAASGSSAAGG